MMTISVMDANGWGETVEGYQWSDSGDELLVQFTESLRVYRVKGSAQEVALRRVEFDDVLGMGWTDGDWWTVTKHAAGIVFRRGLDGQDVPLEEATAGIPSAVTVSPDGQTVVGAVDGPELVFWSTGQGKRLFSIRIETGEPHPLGGQFSIESMRWSPDSRRLAVQPGFPLGDLMVVDVVTRRVIE